MGVTIPFVVLVTAFIMALLGLGTWLLTLERRKVDKRDFEKYSSSVESRMTGLHAEIMTRLRELQEHSRLERKEVLDQLKEIGQNMRHIETCPYLDDKRREIP